MSVVHPTRAKVEALRQRWTGQEGRLRAIARDLRAGRDWTAHLRGLPHIGEIPPLEGEAYGRDLRGADLQRYLRPEADITLAGERESGLVAAIGFEGLRNNTALPGLSPFPVQSESAAEIALAMRRGERFYLARCDGEPVGVVRCVERREFQGYTDERPYLEISGLAVLPRWRGTGIGAALLAKAEALGDLEGFAYALLRTTYEVGLVPWYVKLGYVERGVRQLTYPGAPTYLDVILAKRLRFAQTTAQAAPLRIVHANPTRRTPSPVDLPYGMVHGALGTFR